MLTTGPRGTHDIIPAEAKNWRRVEEAARKICEVYHYGEIRTPIFEHTELFLRGIGETTDVVQKEMYTFTDRGNRSVTLRPENTAAVVRSYLEQKLYAEAQAAKLFYIGPMFRYDRPQAGRLRQFHQFGIEAIGPAGPSVDAEIIELAVRFFEKLGLNDLNLLINSVGCPKCRPQYRLMLQEFLQDKKDQLCGNCQSRYDRNPMRILDCKEEKCNQLSAGAPQMVDCLCDECAEHFAGLRQFLDAAGINYALNPRLVRGLDYYTKTAFEIQYPLLGAQSAVCGGGRYDGLIEECGGPATPGIGFAIGLERVLLAMEKQALLDPSEDVVPVWVLPLGKEASLSAYSLLTRLRQLGIASDMDHGGRSLKSQMKQANRTQARYVAIIGEDEARTNKVTLKNMTTGEQALLSADEAVKQLEQEMNG
ncbi:MAG: hisS [Firmicutes bacterium]|nr:hisS [Bacillota bacterium]